MEISILNRLKSVHHEEPEEHEGKLKDKDGIADTLSAEVK
jgi:hypothetical protein